MESHLQILVVDDEPLNLEILAEYIEDEGHIPICAEDGEEAWEILQSGEHNFSAVLLDRMMPGMDGLELLKRIKKEEQWKYTPVIMQTALSDKGSVDEGLQAGAYYYLTKPYDKATLLSIFNSALDDFATLSAELASESEQPSSELTLPCSISFQTLEEANSVIEQIVTAFPEKPELRMGLSELMINAIEHGNLGISYDDKSHLNSEGKWSQEISDRLTQEQYKSLFAELCIERTDTNLKFHIKDQGNGFDWQEYLELSPERAFDSHGRGIAMANMVCFASIEYLGCGNEVIAIAEL